MVDATHFSLVDTEVRPKAAGSAGEVTLEDICSRCQNGPTLDGMKKFLFNWLAVDGGSRNKHRADSTSILREQNIHTYNVITHVSITA